MQIRNGHPRAAVIQFDATTWVAYFCTRVALVNMRQKRHFGVGRSASE